MARRSRSVVPRINWGDPEAKGLLSCRVAVPNGVMDLVTGEIGVRTGTADPTRTNSFGQLEAFYDGTGDRDSFGSSFTLNDSAPFTVVVEYFVDAFSPDAFATLAHVKCTHANGPLQIFSTTNATYKDVSFGIRATGVYKAAFPANISTTGEQLWFVWAFDGTAFSSVGSHDAFINGVECTLSVSGAFATNTNASTIGGPSTATTADLNGSVRQVRVYDYAWDIEQARRFYTPATRDSLFSPPRRRIYLGSPAVVGPNYTLTAAAGSFTLTGNATGLVAARKLSAAQGLFTFTGNAAALKAGRVLTAAAGSYTLTGNAATLKASRVITAAVGTFTLTGNDATLTYTPVGTTYTLTAAAGAFTLTGNAAGLVAARVLTADAGAYVLTGQDATLTYPYTVSAVTTSAGGVKKKYLLRDFCGEHHGFRGNETTNLCKTWLSQNLVASASRCRKSRHCRQSRKTLRYNLHERSPRRLFMFQTSRSILTTTRTNCFG